LIPTVKSFPALAVGGAILERTLPAAACKVATGGKEREVI
jgi:hypothetical protein